MEEGVGVIENPVAVGVVVGDVSVVVADFERT